MSSPEAVHQEHYAEDVAQHMKNYDHDVHQHDANFNEQVYKHAVHYAHNYHLHMKHYYESPRSVPANLHGFLNPNDGVAISFWIISIAMIASTVFFLMESAIVVGHWKTSMNVGALVTLIAGVHYLYMREFWVTFQRSPIVYRYIDWSLTVPLQMIEFFLILTAANAPLSQGSFWRLLIGTCMMLTFGYMGEAEIMGATLGFILGMAGWGFILYEIFMGEAGQCAGKDIGVYVQSAYSTMRFIVSVGWSIYPLGYFFGYLMGSVEDSVLNLIYNLADFVNKIGFCLAIWHAAKKETKMMSNSAH